LVVVIPAIAALTAVYDASVSVIAGNLGCVVAFVGMNVHSLVGVGGERGYYDERDV
jgi:hypothetical protein